MFIQKKFNCLLMHLNQKIKRSLFFMIGTVYRPVAYGFNKFLTLYNKLIKYLFFFSPEYDKSPVCWDEFQCAKLMEYNRKKSIIQTVYLYGYKETEMPPIMGIYSYIDCREGSVEKLKACVQLLVQ